MEKDIKKSRKNLGVKLKVYYDKMEEKIENFGLIPSDYDRHHFCTYEVFQIQFAFEDVAKTKIKEDLTNIKIDKDQILKVIAVNQN